MNPEIKPIIYQTLARKNNCEAMQELAYRVDASTNTNQVQLLEPSQQIIENKEEKVSFGEHLENTVLGSLDKIDDMIKRHKEWNDESVALGLISDDEKLRTLKADLYREVRLRQPNQELILNLTQAIQMLEEIKHTKETRELEHRKLNLTFPAQINGILNTSLAFILLIVLGSYAASFTCGNALTPFCGYARSVVYPINKFFSPVDADN
ncbi:hypothetical protein [Scytonema sp. UIC 10036]|uniref:hypothetical protein n=1 Tax=Scytonema sp. UIC 10036 TaxID=2304196 RepID=UPI00140FD6F5|nr:hypothetical protein [Scytonema sp. UIC 10036]